MKKQTYIILLLLFSLGSHAQTWQWQKRGGGSGNLSNTNETISSDPFKIESVIDLVTDSDNNVYTLSVVQKNNLNVDGNPKTHLGEYNSTQAILLSSFSCNGTYRWSKILTCPGSWGATQPQMVIDAQDNIYIAGYLDTVKAYNNTPNNFFDSTYSHTVTANFNDLTYTNANTLFLIKYNKDGVFQWIRFPEDPVKLEQDYYSLFPYVYGMEIDSNGVIHMLCRLYADVWGTGANTYTVQAADTEKLHILKYDTAGNFVGGQYLNFKPAYDSIGRLFFKINEVTQSYVFGIFRTGTNEAQPITQAFINGIQMINRSALFAFGTNGVFQWRHDYEPINGAEPYHLLVKDIDVLDAQGNMLITGIVGNYMAYDGHDTSYMISSGQPMVMKVSPTGNFISINHKDNNYSVIAGWASSEIKNNYIYSTMNLSNTTNWDGITHISTDSSPSANAGVAIFDKNTLELLRLDEIPSTVGYTENSSKLALDNIGNVYIGGAFQYNQTVNGQTQYSNGGESDFFVAKYGSANCSCQAPTCSFKPKKSTTLNYAYNFTYIGQEVYTSVLWDFGDGTTSTETNPSHTYTNPGTYTVCVTATNSCDSFQYCKQVTATVLEAHQPFLEELTFMPNPVVDVLRFSQLDEYVIYTLYNLNGQIVDKGDMSPNQPQINLERITPGNYIIKLENKDKQIKTIKVIKE